MIVTILGAGGGGAAVLATINGVFKLLSGASHRERIRSTNLIAQRIEAVAERIKSDKERDEADDRRREAEEHVSILKRQVIELGATPRERPDF